MGLGRVFLFEGVFLLFDVINVTCRGLAITADACWFVLYSGRFSSAEEQDVARGRGDIKGIEARRFKRRLVSTNTCGDVEAGNEADCGNGVDGRVRVTERFRGPEGGVGGVDIQVGGAVTSDEACDCDCQESAVAATVDSSASVIEMACPSSERGLCEDMVDVGVQTGEAVMDGRGRKPHVAAFRGPLSLVGDQTE